MYIGDFWVFLIIILLIAILSQLDQRKKKLSQKEIQKQIQESDRINKIVWKVELWLAGILIVGMILLFLIFES